MPKDLNSIQAGFHQEADVNNPSTRTFKGKNLFPQSFVHPSTCQYGFVDPVAVAKCEVGDVFPYKFVTDLNTFTLSSPLKSKVKMYSSAFKVPMKAIYPRNWDIMLPIPNKGDDVPEDTRAIFNFKDFIDSCSSALSRLLDTNDFDLFVRLHFVLESIFSTGGIFSKMNYHFWHHPILAYVEGSTKSFLFDEYFDNVFCPKLKAYFATLPTTGTSSNHLVHYTNTDNGYVAYCVTDDPKLWGSNSGVNTYYISFTRAIELLRTGEYILQNSGGLVSDSFSVVTILSTSLVDKINIEPIIAYQLACSHFFNNAKIDYIYSAPLYRDNLESIILSKYDLRTFDYNGVNKIYDVFSAANLNRMFNVIDFESLVFFSNLFNFHNSLRYGDYFTGAHPEPIAPGDINAPVIDGSVSALDMTKKLQMARLLNKVNITGPRIADYIRSILGGSLPEAPDDVPVRLSKEVFDVGGFEVNNTGAAQLSDNESDQNITTTNLRLDSSKFMFEVNIDEPCWIVMVQYFEAHRIYSKTLDRFAFHYDRFDDFIPDLQYIGDQDIKVRELDSDRNTNLPFAFTLRNMEYKQRYSYASGGFINKLKSWAFITDNRDGNPSTANITPEFIRSSPSEFDRFYKNLSGYSLGNRFHFITFNTNVCAPYRQMVFAPEILN